MNLSGMNSLGRSKLRGERNVGYWLQVTRVCDKRQLASSIILAGNYRVQAREPMYLLVLLTFPGIHWPQTLSPPAGVYRSHCLDSIVSDDALNPRKCDSVGD